MINMEQSHFGHFGWKLTKKFSILYFREDISKK